MRKLVIVVCELDDVSYLTEWVNTILFDSPLYDHAHRKIMDAANKLSLDVKFVSADVHARKTQNFDLGSLTENSDIVAVVSPLVFLAPAKVIEDALKCILNNKFTYSTVGNPNDYYAVFGYGEMISQGYDITSCDDFINSIKDTGAIYTHKFLLEKEKASPQSRIEYFKKIEDYRQELLDYFIMSGVDIENKDGIIISPTCVIRTGAKILPNTQIYKGALIKENCVIGPNAVISNSEIGESSIVENSKITDSVLGYSVTVESFCKIVNNCKIENWVKIFNGCTIENSHVGLKSTVYPNAILIEAKIGEKAVIGSSTVTVKPIINGRQRKTYQCRIGDYAVIGCNSTLIEPLEIGNNALVAAGSVITDSVPENALAIAREFQETKENKAKKRKRF